MNRKSETIFIDTTMKTVWTAELEVLQKAAEICDRQVLYGMRHMGLCWALSGMKVLFHGMTIWISG